MAGAALDPERLDVLRALADPTRNALYRELHDSAGTLTTQELATRVGLHPNTVRGHLDQLCAVGLVRADTSGHGGRGRPRHRFAALPLQEPPAPTASRSRTPPPSDRPSSIGGPSSAAPLASTTDPGPAAGETTADLARCLVEVAEEARVPTEVIRRVGHRVGRARLSPPSPRTAAQALELVLEHEARDGYGPRLEVRAPGRWQLTFASCPFRDLATDFPEVVCSLHAGSLDGLCAATGRVVLESFTPLQGGQGCSAVLTEDSGDGSGDRRYHPIPTKED